MPDASIIEGSTILLPSAGEIDRRSLIAGMVDAQIRVCDIDLPLAQAAPFATRVCAAIQVARPAAPLIIVAPPSSAAHLPAIALAQRAAHRRVTAYILMEPGLISMEPSLIDGAVSPTGADWPDAPVTCISLAAAEPSWVRLRSWQAVRCRTLHEAAAAIRACGDASVSGANPVDHLR